MEKEKKGLIYVLLAAVDSGLLQEPLTVASVATWLEETKPTRPDGKAYTIPASTLLRNADRNSPKSSPGGTKILQSEKTPKGPVYRFAPDARSASVGGNIDKKAGTIPAEQPISEGAEGLAPAQSEKGRKKRGS